MCVCMHIYAHMGVCMSNSSCRLRIYCLIYCQLFPLLATRAPGSVIEFFHFLVTGECHMTCELFPFLTTAACHVTFELFFYWPPGSLFAMCECRADFHLSVFAPQGGNLSPPTHLNHLLI